MQIDITLSNGEVIRDTDEVGFWRSKILNKCQREKLKIRQIVINGEIFMPTADSYFMIFQQTAFTNGYTSAAKGIGYVKNSSNHAKITWYMNNSTKLVEVKKPIPRFIYEIMVEREV